MTRIRVSFILLCALLTGLWLMADPLLTTAYQYNAMRLSLINYTGIITIGVMSVAMMLALRPVFLETALGGLDKTYRLHKWLGVGALLTAAKPERSGKVSRRMGILRDGRAHHPRTDTEIPVSVLSFDASLRFLIKHLGDYTSSLPARLKVGDLVTVEGPYGRFNFSGRKDRQIWISGDIGITPFISRMEELAKHPDGKTIDLFHATSVQDVETIDKLRAIAQKANVNMHVWVSAQDGFLTAERIKQDVPDWKSADLWFCGPIQFGQDLRKDFRASGLSANAFHEELFHLR